MEPHQPNPARPTEPDASEWMTGPRRELVTSQFSKSEVILKMSGLWRASLGYWVRWQASLDADWPSEQQLLHLDKLVTEWRKENVKIQNPSIHLDDQLVRAKLRVAPAVAKWSRQQWAHKLENLYLLRKNDLDKASCKLIRLKDKYLAHEIYHRIKEREMTFEDASFQFGIGQEAAAGGLLKLQPLSRMPFGLAALLQRLSPNQLSMPMRLGKGFCIVQLISLESSQLDANTEELLLAEQLQLWIDYVVDYIETNISFA